MIAATIDTIRTHAYALKFESCMCCEIVSGIFREKFQWEEDLWVQVEVGTYCWRRDGIF